VGVRQLYDLQCLEQNIASGEEALAKAQAQLGENQILKQAKVNFAKAEAGLAAIRAEQKTAEYAVADLVAKMTVTNESLYSGRIQNPKELQNLQQELATWQAQRNQLEEKSLTLMEMAEREEAKVRRWHEDLVATETQWQEEQATLINKIKSSEQALEALKLKRACMTKEIPSDDLALYDQLRKTRGWAVARLEQGSCGHCRLGLSTASVQRARSGQTVTCPSCGRLLFYE